MKACSTPSTSHMQHKLLYINYKLAEFESMYKPVAWFLIIVHQQIVIYPKYWNMAAWDKKKRLFAGFIPYDVVPHEACNFKKITWPGDGFSPFQSAWRSE